MVKDIRTLEEIYTLVKERGFTLEGAKKELKRKSKPDSSQEIVQRLKTTKEKLESIIKNL
jgi:DNA-binding transcriptional MerR regulator